MSDKKTPKADAKKAEPTPAAAPAKLPKGGATFINIPMEKVSIKKGFNPRADLDTEELAELKKAVKEHGLLQPIVVAPTKPGADTYYVVAGHRRFLVCSELGRPVIPATVKDVAIDSVEAKAMAVAENAGGPDGSRKDLAPLDLARAFKEISEALGGDGKEGEVAAMTGYKASYVKTVLRLHDVPDIVKKRLEKKEISFRAAQAVLAAPDDIRDKVAKRISAGDDERDVRVIVNDVRAEAKAEAKAADDKAPKDKKADAKKDKKASAHNRPIGTPEGVIPIIPGNRVLRRTVAELAAIFKKAKADEAAAEKAKDEDAAGKANATWYAAKNQLAGLLYALGSIKAIDLKADDFKAALEDAVDRCESYLGAEADAKKDVSEPKAEKKDKKADKSKTGKVEKKDDDSDE